MSAKGFVGKTKKISEALKNRGIRGVNVKTHRILRNLKEQYYSNKKQAQRKYSYLRGKRDLWQTPPEAIEPLIDSGILGDKPIVWDPCAGTGITINTLKEHIPNGEYYGTDICHENDLDFLDKESDDIYGEQFIITNPPFEPRLLYPIIRQALERRRKSGFKTVVALLLPNKVANDMGNPKHRINYMETSRIPINSRIKFISPKDDKQQKTPIPTGCSWYLWGAENKKWPRDTNNL